MNITILLTLALSSIILANWTEFKAHWATFELWCYDNGRIGLAVYAGLSGAVVGFAAWVVL